MLFHLYCVKMGRSLQEFKSTSLAHIFEQVKIYTHLLTGEQEDKEEVCEDMTDFLS